MNRALQQTFFFFGACFIISQTLCAGFITYNDFGSPRDRNNFTSRIGITSIELKSDTGSVVKADKLIDSVTKKTSNVNLQLTVNGTSSGQSQIGSDAPDNTDAGKVFGGIVNCQGGTPLPAGKVHFVDISGLDSGKLYELVLYSSTSGGSGSKPILFTLWDVVGFENRSDVVRESITISGQNNRTTMVKTMGNDSSARGDVCRYKSILTGSDGDIRVIIQSPEGGILNALMLREQRPPVLSSKPLIELGEDYAVIRGAIADPAKGLVEMRWRESGSMGSWKSVELSPEKSGSVVVRLDSLPVFVEQEFVFVQRTVDGERVSDIQSIRPQQLGLIYSTGFEPAEALAFLPGEIISQIGPWRVVNGKAEVQGKVVAHGGQAVRTGDCIIEMTLENTEPVLWADAFIQDPGINQKLQIPEGKASSVLFFHDAKLIALDGNGSGGGAFKTITKLLSDRFMRLTIRTDYQSKRFDVWVDGKLESAELGFKDNSVTSFHGAKRLAGANSYLDDFSLSTWGIDRDSDNDGLNDLDEAKFYGSYPLLADSDRDGASDALEISSGTRPDDASSVFALNIGVTAGGVAKLNIPTLTGLEYTLQRRAMFGQGRWKNISGFENVKGDGSVKSFLETPDGRNYFYRGVIVNRLNP